MISGLQSETGYYGKAFAADENGTVYGEQFFFTTESARAPRVNTDSISDKATNSAVFWGTIEDNGGLGITEQGFCWAHTFDPTLKANHLNVESGTDHFSAIVSSLLPSSLYFVRAYGINPVDTSYGDSKEFMTLKAVVAVPEVDTKPVIDITSSSAKSGGIVRQQGGSEILSRGVCWGTDHNPDLNDQHTSDGSGLGTFDSQLTSLECNTVYYVRAYASNADTTGYGTEIEFITNPCLD